MPLTSQNSYLTTPFIRGQPSLVVINGCQHTIYGGIYLRSYQGSVSVSPPPRSFTGSHSTTNKDKRPPLLETGMTYLSVTILLQVCYNDGMKVIRISDELHTKLKEHADIDRRSINAEAEIIFELYFGDAEGGLQTEEVAKKRLLENQAVKAHIVKEGQELGLLDLHEEDGQIPPKKISADAPRRSMGDVLADIRKLEADRDEELRYCQDEEVGRGITLAYADRIQPLWDEYHGLKDEA